jgi:hypothetical protein
VRGVAVRAEVAKVGFGGADAPREARGRDARRKFHGSLELAEDVPPEDIDERRAGAAAKVGGCKEGLIRLERCDG